MLRKILTSSALLPVLLSCRDDPTMPTPPPTASQPEAPDPLVPSAELAAIRELLEDPQLGAMVDQLPDRELAKQVAAKLENAVRAAQEGNRRVLQDALTAARDGLTQTDDPDEMVLVATIGIVLDHAQTLLATTGTLESQKRPRVDLPRPADGSTTRPPKKQWEIEPLPEEELAKPRGRSPDTRFPQQEKPRRS